MSRHEPPRHHGLLRLALVAPLLAAACSTSDMVAPDESVAIAERRTGSVVIVPFSGRLTTIGGGVEFGGPCPVLTIHVVATGTATHFGRIHVAQHHCLNPFGPDPLAFDHGYIDVTAANGDQAFGSYAGLLGPTADPDHFTFTGEWQFTGGTGRFAGLGGGGDAAGETNLATGGGWTRLTGSVSFPRP